ncbi:hypothetical protein N431DRAFT_477682 [Stipitochalara longipes BDJ]|nr:hypothetical protein N431DRAFT_477682 [Stipitochalara longipes BDJ]
MRLSYFIPILLAFAQDAAAKPAAVEVEVLTEVVVERANQDLEDRSLICKIDAVLLAFKAVAALATPFCSSYLQIPTSTQVIPTTPLTTTTLTTTTTTVDVVLKRAHTPVPIPPGLGLFVASQISSACSCLSIPETVVKSTSTAPTVVITTTDTLTATSTTTHCPIATSGTAECHCNYYLYCQEFCTLSSGTPNTGVPDLPTCIQMCDQSSTCVYFFYEPSSQICYTYTTYPACSPGGTGIAGDRAYFSCTNGNCDPPYE